MGCWKTNFVALRVLKLHLSNQVTQKFLTMKTLNLFNYVILKSSTFVALLFLVSVSCSSDDDNNNLADNFASLPTSNLVTYSDGSVTYNGSNGTVIVNANTATATITGTSANYTISFSDNVPSITNIRFARIDDTYKSVIINGTNDSAQSIVIDGNTLAIASNINGNTWAFSNN